MSPALEDPGFPDDPTERRPPETRVPDWTQDLSSSGATFPMGWSGAPPADESSPVPDETDPAFAPRSPRTPPTRPAGGPQDSRKETRRFEGRSDGGPTSYSGGSIAPGQVLSGRYEVIRLLGRG